MYNQHQEEKEYAEFLSELAQKAGELMDKYQHLSPENQNRISALCRRIVTTQGIVGLSSFIKDPLNF